MTDRYLELLFEEENCPWTAENLGDSVESPIVDDNGIHAFTGTGRIVLWERLVYAAAERPFIKVTVSYRVARWARAI